jgi:hypothetical protein
MLVYLNARSIIGLFPFIMIAPRSNLGFLGLRSGFEPSDLDRPGRLPHQGLCEARLGRGYQDESGFKFLSELVSVYLRASGLNRDLNLKFSTGRT